MTNTQTHNDSDTYVTLYTTAVYAIVACVYVRACVRVPSHASIVSKGLTHANNATR